MRDATPDPIAEGPIRDEAAGQHLPVVETFDGFFRREYPRLVTLARGLSGSAEHAEDIAQEAMVVMLRRWDEVPPLDNPSAYARRTCANLAVSSRRRRWAEMRAFLRVAGRREPLPALPDADDRFWDEVRRLPRREAQVVALHYGCDVSVVDIGEVLGIAEGTVKAHLSHARSRLSDSLGDRTDPPTLEGAR